MYYGARYYDRQVGAFISPDTLVPDPTNVWDYNRYGYARLNPMKFNDPTGHCTTLEDGSPNWEGKVNYQCWQTAYAIYGYGVAGLAAFQQDWKVAADDWLENIAKQEFATTEYLQPFLNKYNSQFCAQAGLNCGQYVPNPSPQFNSANSGLFGISVGGSLFIFSVSVAVEVLIHENGQIAIYGSRGAGVGVGAGGDVRIYKATLYDLKDAGSYRGPAKVIDFTAGPVVLGELQALPQGAHGYYYGFAVGARASASVVGQDSPPAYIVVDLANMSVSSPYMEQQLTTIKEWLK